MGGVDDKQFEVFYGNRPIGMNKSIGSSFQILTNFDIAHGASLRYGRTDDGHVVCILNPAETENLKHPEKGIILEIVKDPADLIRKVPKHWKSFISYMETTCIDGKPSCVDRLRIYWLRNFRSLIFKESTNPPLAKKFGSTILQNFFTVGLSGFLILIITWAREGIREKETEQEKARLIETLDGIKALEVNRGSEAILIRREIETISKDAQSGGQQLQTISKQLDALKTEIREARESLKPIHIEKEDARKTADPMSSEFEDNEGSNPELERLSR